MEPTRKSIFEYTNFREYLTDFFEESKKTDPLMSHRYLSSRIGLSTPNLIWLVMKGKRNLSLRVCERLIKYLRLTKRRAEYFRSMVAFLQAKKHAQKDRHFSHMMEMRRPLKVKKIDAQQYEYYNNWYNPVIRELVTSPDFNGDYNELGLKVSPPVPKQQARNSVELLLRLGMIRKKNGRFIQTESVVSTGPEVRSFAVINYHRNMAGMAASSFDRGKSDERNITAVTLSLSKSKYQQLVRETSDFRSRVMALMDPCGKDTKVFQVNIQVFPVSRVPSKRKRRKRK